MGWSKVQHTEDIIGDEPLELLEDAIEGITASYMEAFGRLPTKAEWSHLLNAVFQAYAKRATEDAPVRNVRIE